MEAVTLLGWDPLPSSVAASPYWESWADVKAKLATSLGEQKALNGGDSWCVSVLWTDALRLKVAPLHGSWPYPLVRDSVALVEHCPIAQM